MTWTKRLLTRRNFLGLALSGSASAGVSFGYMRFVEAGWLEVNEREVPLAPPTGARLKGLSAELRLLHLSDLHASPDVSLEYLNQAIQKGIDLKPDLICLTGDFITTKYDQFHEYGQALRKLARTAPTFMGNHDGVSTSPKALATCTGCDSTVGPK